MRVSSSDSTEAWGNFHMGVIIAIQTLTIVVFIIWFLYVLYGSEIVILDSGQSATIS